MINIKKGIAHSLQQSDTTWKAETGITAGMLCYVDPSTSKVAKATATAPAVATGGLLGFAIQNSTDGDAIESGKISLYMCDGNSVIETDQYTGTPTIGYHVVPSATAGSVTFVTAANASVLPVIGVVEGTRALPSTPTWGGGVPAAFGGTRTNDWPTTTLVSIKLSDGLVRKTVA